MYLTQGKHREFHLGWNVATLINRNHCYVIATKTLPGLVSVNAPQGRLVHASLLLEEPGTDVAHRCLTAANSEKLIVFA